MMKLLAFTALGAQAVMAGTKTLPDAVCNTPPDTILEPEGEIVTTAATTAATTTAGPTTSTTPPPAKCTGDVTAFKIIDAEGKDPDIMVAQGDSIPYSTIPDRANIEAIVASGTSKVSFYSAGKFERDDTTAPFTFSEFQFVKKYNDDGTVKETEEVELYDLMTGGPKYFKAVGNDNVECDVSFMVTGAPGKICKPDIQQVFPCEGDKCLGPTSCTLKRGGRGFEFEAWPDVTFADRPDVYLQMMIIDSGTIFNFTQSDMVDENGVQIDTTGDDAETFFSLAYTDDAIWNQLYNSQYNGGLAFQFISKNGPGGWNQCQYSPIAMAIFGDTIGDHPGRITGEFAIDIDGNQVSGTEGNGDEYLTEWFAPNVGILVHDPPADGHVSGVHLMGDMGGKYSDGFEKLTQFDTDSNGWIDGDELNAFHVWVDANSDAHLDDGELYEMADLNIAKIWTQHECHQSTGEFVNGTTFFTEDLWFAR